VIYARGGRIVVERYSAEHVKAVILHPDDLAELQGSSELLDDLTVTLELSDLGARGPPGRRVARG